jgi:hypothetical protein
MMTAFVGPNFLAAWMAYSLFCINFAMAQDIPIGTVFGSWTTIDKPFTKPDK